MELAAGPALRVSQRTDDGFVSLGMLVPAPRVAGGLAVVALLSPSLIHEQRINEMFDLLADTFTFTWDGESPRPHRRLPTTAC